MGKEQSEIDYSKPLSNDKYEAFCQQYIIDNNATQAAIRAGYSERTAGSKGTQLLQIVNIKGRIAYLQGQLAEECGVTAKKVITELTKIGFANIKSVLSKGNEIVDISQLPDEIAAAVESIQSDIRHDSGDSKGYTEKVKVKFHSKLGALNDLGKHLGIFGKDNEQRQGLTLADIAAMAGVIRADS